MKFIMKFSFHYYFSIFIESKIKIILFKIIKLNFYYILLLKSIKSCLY